MKNILTSKKDLKVTSSHIQEGIEYLAFQRFSETLARQPVTNEAELIISYKSIDLYKEYLDAISEEFRHSAIPSKKGAPSKRKSSSVSSRFGFVKGSTRKQ